MDRDQAASENLLDQENKLIAEILAGFRAIIRAGTDRVDNTASTGQAAFNSMAMEIHMNGLIKSTEDLLGLTRQLRELWVVGPLKKPGEGDDETQQLIRDDAARYFETLSAMRRAQRLREITVYQGNMSYQEGPLQGNPAPPRGPDVPSGMVASAQTGGRA